MKPAKSGRVEVPDKNKWGVPKKKVVLRTTAFNVNPRVREIRELPSLNSKIAVTATLKPKQVYTGTKMIGIGVMHKSNSVPIFTEDEAVDLSKMRR